MGKRRYPGEGSIFQRRCDGRWIAAVSEGPRGNRVIRRRYAPLRNNTKAEAKRLLAEMLEHQDPTTETTSAYTRRWADEARNIRDSTRRGYKAVIETWVDPTIGHIKLAQLTPAHIEALLAQVEAQRSPKTARNVHAVMRRALGQAVRTGVIPRNVAAREFVDTPRVPVEEPRSLTDDEIERLLAVSSLDRLHALFVLAIDGGLRQGELLGLAWEDVDGSTIHVRRELVYTPGERLANGKRKPGKYHRGELKTPRSRRDVPLTERAQAALVAHRERLIAEGFDRFLMTGGRLLFVTKDGEEISGSWLTHHLYSLLAEAGIPRLPFKNLRTSFASRLADRGVSELTIATLLGHARTTTTKKHYIAGSDQSREDAIRRLAG